MKAEHRKELETNVLADRMGRMVESIKNRPQGRSLFWIVLGLVVVLALFITYRLRVGAQQDIMERWMMLEIGKPEYLARMSGIGQGEGETMSAPDNTNAGKAARFQMARFLLWDQGVRFIGSDEKTRERAMDNIRVAERLYEALKKDCEGELEFEAEALYALAVIDETRALQNQDYLATAQTSFEKIANDDKYKNSSFAPLAEKRAKQLKENGEAIGKLYRDLQTKLGIPEEKKLPLAFP